MIPIPERWWAKLLRRPYSYDVALAFFSLFGGLAGIIVAFSKGTVTAGLLLATATTGVLVFSIGKAILQHALAQQLESVHELEGCLEAMHALLRIKYDEQRNAGLRITVHTATIDGEWFVQVLDYVGDDRGGATSGRRFRSTEGVIGECKRNQVATYGTRESDIFSDYVQDLVNRWNFTEVGARKLNQQTMSWFAVPLITSSKLKGLVYLDSIKKRHFFDDQNLRTDVEAFCAGIAKFVDKRYA